MGAAASKQSAAAPTTPAPEDKQAHHLQFGRSLLNQLDKTSLDKVEGPDATRQVTLDTSIQAKIKSELERLRKEEAEVRGEIQKAIEKENLAREAKYTGASEGKNSNVLRQELDQLRGKIDKYNKQRDVSNYPGVKEAQEALVKCYRDKPERTLDCWKQADDFKQAVANAEKHFISSFS
ncbi:DUF1690 domain-containing protein [Moesziomyces antarcticus]|uniref:DUF1690 domain-containing protein n=2 Tax=Pseudozyma antarctica TaxID=84753 RepID=A0A081CCL4_PSEA2|nr:DUF1690 domain-containing protein [Moesziomyces antarcticus]GAC71781.1 hypothetical protein PANT_5c00070 [Moesziomyces antarcticus T-34]GAK64410.1 DUF1690 domain-containing protein [Moesziomyces antarcticus]